MRRRVSRRQVLRAAAAGAAAAAFPATAVAQGVAARVVVVGGGFGGAGCARALRKLHPKLQVTLVEAQEIYTAMPHSNAVLGGLVRLSEQQFGYERLRKEGVDVVIAALTELDPLRKRMKLSSGASLDYDRLVVSPGIAFRANSIAGYDEAAMRKMPAAYRSGEEVDLLRRQLEAMEDGGTVVISSPVNPARCPPAPYERASLIAFYLKKFKPRSKVVVLDSKESFTMQKLFESAWRDLYPGMIEWIGLSQGGEVTSVDVGEMSLSTDFDTVKAAVASVIPPQKAGSAAEIAGVADRTGWCPVDPVTFESRQQRDVHVIGDAAIAGAMPRSASAAVSQASICAAAIVAQLAGRKPEAPTLTSSCYSLIAPDYAISQKGTYRPVEDQYVEADHGVLLSAANAPANERAKEAREAKVWFREITTSVFG